MRNALSISAHVFFILIAVSTAIYNVYRFVESVKLPDKTFWGVASLVLFVIYTAAVLRIDFYLFLNAGSLAYGVGREKKSHVVLSVLVLISGLFFVIPPVISLVYFVISGGDLVWGRWLPFALLADLAVYLVTHWIRFLSSVSEGG